MTSNQYRSRRFTIKSLNELSVDSLYLTERETPIFRVSKDEVCIGGKIIIPVMKDGCYKNVTHMWKGKLYPETLSIAIEHFLKKNFEEGIPFSDSEKYDKGCVLFDLEKMPLQKLYVTVEDNVMIKRMESNGPIDFVLGRHLHWHSIMKEKILNPDHSSKLLGRDHPKGEKDVEAYEMQNIVEAPISPIKIDLINRQRAGKKSNRTVMIIEDVPQDNSRIVTRAYPAKHTPSRTPLSRKSPRSKRSPLSHLSPHGKKSPLSMQTPTQRGRHASGNQGDKSLIKSPLEGFNLMTPPPPPPPPPMLNNYGTPPPPPIGMMSPNNLNRKKLRQLHWSRIPMNKIDNTIWGESESPSKTLIDVNEVELETLFSLSPPKPAPAKNEKKLKRLSILDLRKANNGSILLTQLRMSIDEIVEAIESMDDEKFTLENLLALKNLFPLSDDEKKKFKQFDGETSLLPLSERFYIATMKMDNVEVRIDSMLMKKQFDTLMNSIQGSIDSLTKGCDEVHNNKKLAKILKSILRLGCTLNRRTSSGFRLDILPKLSETKSKDGTTSVLDYLVQKLNEQNQDVLDFVEQLPSLEMASRISLEIVREEILEIGKGLADIHRELSKCQTKVTAGNNDKENQQENGNVKKNLKPSEMSYIRSMKAFYDESFQVYQQMKVKFKKSITDYHNVVQYFGEDVKTNNPETFFGNLKKFSNDFKVSCNRNVK